MLNIIDNPLDVAIVTYTPTKGSKVKVLDSINVTMTAEDSQGNVATCSFFLVIKRKYLVLILFIWGILGYFERAKILIMRFFRFFSLSECIIDLNYVEQ